MHRLAPEFGKLFRDWRALIDHTLKPHGLSFALWQVLDFVSRAEGPVTQVEIANGTGVEPSTLTRQLDQMEAAQLIVRSSSPHDRRVKLIRLGAEAAGRMPELSAAVQAEAARVLDGVDPAEICGMREVVQQLRRRLVARELAAQA